MQSLLLLSQLIIPQIPSDVTEDNFIKETIKTFSCVKDVEEDGVAHALDQETGVSSDIARLIVTVKNQAKVAQCAEEITSTIDGLTLEQTFTIIPAFVLSYEVPAPLKPVKNQDQGVSPDVLAN